MPARNPEYPIITRTSRAPAVLGFAPSTFHHLAKTDPTFPRKLVFGKQTTGYLTAELLAWAESKKARLPQQEGEADE
jgi:predicted DNA-binding transcriptional regulator AlpA